MVPLQVNKGISIPTNALMIRGDGIRVAVVGSDLALDVLPSGVEGFELPVHWVCIVAMGVPILDNCDLEKVSAEANARKRWEFLLTVAPLAVTGGTGSPVNPLATY